MARPAWWVRTAASSSSDDCLGSWSRLPTVVLVPVGVLRGLVVRPQKRFGSQRPLQERTFSAVRLGARLGFADRVARIHSRKPTGFLCVRSRRFTKPPGQPWVEPRVLLGAQREPRRPLEMVDDHLLPQASVPPSREPLGGETVDDDHGRESDVQEAKSGMLHGLGRFQRRLPLRVSSVKGPRHRTSRGLALPPPFRLRAHGLGALAEPIFSRSERARASTFSASATRFVLRSTDAYSSRALAWASGSALGAFS